MCACKYIKPIPQGKILVKGLAVGFDAHMEGAVKTVIFNSRSISQEVSVF
jgi:hypothetical protein